MSDWIVKSMLRGRLGRQFASVIARVLLVGLGLSGISQPSSLAAEQITIRYGPLQQTVSLQSLDQFIASGILPAELEAYSFLLTPNLKQSLRQGLQLNPDLSNRGLQEMLASPMGDRLLQVMNRVVPEASPQLLATTIQSAALMPRGLNVINFFRAYPRDTIVIDANAILAVKAQLQADANQSRALGPKLATALLAPQQSLSREVDPAQPGANKIQQQTLKLTDARRQRTLSLVAYTAPETRGPLVVMFHGLGGNQNALAYLARHLASYGLTVVTLKHPDYTALERSVDEYTLGGGLYLPAREFVERPRDVSFLLEQLSRLNPQPGPLQGKFNTGRVTVIGQSLGGTTALTLAGAELDLDSLRSACQAIAPVGRALGDWALCNATVLPERVLRLRDQRIAQAIVINPVVGELFGDLGLAQVQTPTLMFSSTEDTISPAIPNHLRPFTQLPAPKYLVTAIGATHLSTNDVGNLTSTRRVRIISERLGDQNQPLQALIRGTSLAFILQLTPEASRYQSFLTPAYAQSLSTPGMPLRFSTQLPESIVLQLQPGPVRTGSSPPLPTSSNLLPGQGQSVGPRF